MPIGSGLAGQIGIVKESTVNTPVAVTTFIRYLEESLDARIKTAEDTGVAAGALDIPATRRIITGLDAGGSLKFNVPAKGFGRFLQMMMGSSPTAAQISTSGVYTQFHNLGSADGASFTIQKGNPQTGGSVDPLTLSGCKVTAWELTAAAGGLLQANLTIDAQNIQPTGAAALALQTASFATSGDQNFGFNQIGFSTFAAMTVVSSLWTPTTPTPIKVRSFSIKGGQPKKTDRWYAGSSTKDEALGNDFTRATGTISIDYAATTYQTAYLAGTSLGLQMNADGGVTIGTSGTNHAIVQCTMPALKLEDGSPNVSGPDVITVDYPFTVYNDGTNGSMQCYLQSTDAAV